MSCRTSFGMRFVTSTLVHSDAGSACGGILVEVPPVDPLSAPLRTVRCASCGDVLVEVGGRLNTIARPGQRPWPGVE